MSFLLLIIPNSQTVIVGGKIWGSGFLMTSHKLLAVIFIVYV